MIDDRGFDTDNRVCYQGYLVVGYRLGLKCETSLLLL